MTGWARFRGEREPAAPRLRAVSSHAPPRPRWTVLYLALLVISVTGAAMHALVRSANAVELVDAVFAAALFLALIAWIRLNRSAIARTNEPVIGTGRPAVRIVRSRPSLREMRSPTKDHLERART